MSSSKAAHVLEDRKFFLTQYIRTLPLNIMSVAVSVAAWGLWILLDNTPLLGFFSLSSITSSICQQSMLVGSIVQTILPNMADRTRENAILQISWRIDSAILACMLLGTLTFFLVTHADIVHNLGLLAFLSTGILALVEPLPATAIPLCNAKRLYGWMFLINNCRNLTVILGLASLLVYHATTPRLGIGVWGCSILSALTVSLFFFYRQGLNPFERPPKALTHHFVTNIRQALASLVFYRFGILLFASLPSFFIAFIHSPKEIGLVAFSLSLSGFLYSALAPINEQIYGPTFSKLVAASQARLLLRRIFQMAFITVLIAVPAAGLLYVFGVPILQMLHKTSFIGSFSLLPAFLCYRILIMINFGFTHSLFSMNRYKVLGSMYLVSVLAAGAWCFAFRESFTWAVWALPLSAGCVGIISALYVSWLTWKGRSLQSRTMYSMVPEDLDRVLEHR